MNWIKMSDRKPTEADYPIWAESPEWGEPEKARLFYSEGPLLSRDCIQPRSWMPATLPAPPPKEKTQKELDEEALYETWKAAYGKYEVDVSWQTYKSVAHAALKWEREAWRALLDRPLYKSQEKWALLNMDDMNALRKRCGL